MKPRTKKRQKNRIVLIVMVLLASKWFTANGQQTGAVSIALDESPPFESAMLDIISPDKGLIIPRVPDTTTLQNFNVTEGLTVFYTAEGSESYLFWDGTIWQRLSWVPDGYRSRVAPLGGVVMYCGTFDNNFDASGLGFDESPYWGWAICNGANGTPDLRGYFTVCGGASEPYNKIGLIGGANSYILAKENMPKHRHQMADTSVVPAPHTHQVVVGNHNHTLPSTKGNSDSFNRVRRKYKEETTWAYTSGPNGFTAGTANGLKINSTAINVSITVGANTKTQITGQANPIDNRPSYQVIMYIMRIDGISNFSGEHEFNY